MLTHQHRNSNDSRIHLHIQIHNHNHTYMVCVINQLIVINESINFLEIELNDDFKESYSIKTLLDQIKQQILNHK